MSAHAGDDGGDLGQVSIRQRQNRGTESRRTGKEVGSDAEDQAGAEEFKGA